MKNNDDLILKPIAHIYCDVKTKFGVPRQSGIAPDLCGKIIFAKDYQDKNYIKGIDKFSHLWLIWGFSEVNSSKCSPTVRPPILGGNDRIGVFATRSPFRPNPIGLTCVKLEKIIDSDKGLALLVSGIDMMDNTPIYDIKPYIPYADSNSEATGGFTDEVSFNKLEVIVADDILAILQNNLSDRSISALFEILSNNPRPQYQKDDNRIYGMTYSNLEVLFKISNDQVVITEIQINK